MSVEDLFVIVLLLVLVLEYAAERSSTSRSTSTITKKNYLPSGVVTSVPAGGVNSKVEAGIAPRFSFE